MRLFALLVSSILFTTFTHGQLAMRDWRLFTPPGKALDVDFSATHVYAALENGLLEREIESSEKYLWTAANFLSDVNLRAVHVHKPTNTVFVGYANGNIDLIRNNSVFNLPAILLASISGNKQINRFVSDGDYVYVATGIGIVKIDPVKREVRDSYFPTNNQNNILDIAFVGDTIFALTPTTIRFGNKNNIALADFTQWQTYSNLPSTAQGTFSRIHTHQNRLLLIFDHQTNGLDTLYQRIGGVFEPVDGLDGYEINSIWSQGNTLLLGVSGSVLELDANFMVTENVYQYNEGQFVEPNHMVKIGMDYWIADRFHGLVKARNAFSHEKIFFPGPANNDYFSMDWKNGKLAIAGGSIEGNNATFNLAGLYTFSNEEWKAFNVTNQPQMAGGTWDIISTSIDPADANHIAFGTYSNRGLFEIRDGQTIDTWYDENNAPLEKTSLGNQMYFVSQLFFDNSSNLWVTQSFANEPLKMKTKDGVWHEFDLGNAPRNRRIFDLTIDFNGVKWISAAGNGVIAFDDRGTFTDASDDQIRNLRMGPGLGNLPSNNVRSIAVDYNNDIWLGTEVGLAILYNGSNVFTSNSDAQQILIEVDGFVEILLGETVITDIEIDGGNRKWIGTEASGVFLLSSDGREEIYRFTAENSPLISNQILDIEIDHNTGEVFFATDKGLISFRSDASFGDPNYEEVTVFPNPVRPDFTGPVTIQGIGFNSDVRITDSGGNLVYKTVSNGGTATWNGQTLQGERAKSGVYFIWTAEINGKGRKVGKVVFIN